MQGGIVIQGECRGPGGIEIILHGFCEDDFSLQEPVAHCVADEEGVG